MAQLILGLEKPVIEDAGKTLLYMADTWKHKVRQRLNKLKPMVWTEEIWHPEKQRQNDKSIMDKIAAIFGVSKNQVEIANLCQVYL